MKRKARSTRNSLATVRKYFPEVEVVTDAEKPITIEVKDADVKKATRKDHASCAMAVACQRQLHADGVLVGMSIAYVVNGKKAERYALPPSVGREIVSNDRGTGASPGEYHFVPPVPSRRFGVPRWDSNKAPGKKDGSRSRHVHFTDGIRASLASRV